MSDALISALSALKTASVPEKGPMLICKVSKNRRTVAWSNGLAKETHHAQLALITLEKKAESFCDLIVSEFLVPKGFEFQFHLTIQPGTSPKARAVFQDQKTLNNDELENTFREELDDLEKRINKAWSLIKGERTWLTRTSGQNINIFENLRAENAKDAHDLSLVLGQRTQNTPQVIVLEELEIPDDFGNMIPPQDKDIRSQLRDIVDFSQEASRNFRRSFYDVEMYPESMELPGFEVSFEEAKPAHKDAAPISINVTSETFGTFDGACENAMASFETLQFAVKLLALRCLDLPGIAGTSIKMSISAVILEEDVEFKVILENSNFDEEWVYWSAKEFFKDWSMRLSMLESLPEPTSCYCLSKYTPSYKGQIVSAACEKSAVKTWFALTQGFEKITRMPKNILRVPKLLEVRPELVHEID